MTASQREQERRRSTRRRPPLSDDVVRRIRDAREQYVLPLTRSKPKQHDLLARSRGEGEG